jgi:formylmethanofuran--tetrahydromethanopterin N-formyltransferase
MFGLFKRKPDEKRAPGQPPPKGAQTTPFSVRIDDTFAEAFGMTATGLIVTADSAEWAMQAALTATGFATSVIGCGVEAGIDRELSPAETPDGRPGVRILLFCVSLDALQGQVDGRAGQCILTAPGTACYAGVAPTAKPVKLGAHLRYFGDGFQIAKMIGGRRYWRVPVMDGEFLCEDETWAVDDAVGGGNLILLGRSREAALEAAEICAAAIRKVPDVILPFPGGIVRSGSKVGSKYKSMIASTNDAFAPTLRAQSESDLDDKTGSVLELVIDGLSAKAVAEAMKAGLLAAREAGRGLIRITAGNYGGKLGPHHFHLRELAA